MTSNNFTCLAHDDLFLDMLDLAYWHHLTGRDWRLSCEDSIEEIDPEASNLLYN